MSQDPTPKPDAIPDAPPAPPELTTPPSADETPPATPPAEDGLHTKLNTPVTVVLTRTDGTDDTQTFVLPRNMWALMMRLLDKTEKLDLDKYDIKITSPAFKSDGTEIIKVMGQGPAKMVMNTIARQMIPSQAVTQMLFEMATSLLEPTAIRGILISAIFEKQKPFAFAILNHTLGDELKPEDINMLAYHAQTNVDMFKDKMRKQGHKFPDDNPILLPGKDFLGGPLPKELRGRRR